MVKAFVQSLLIIIASLVAACSDDDLSRKSLEYFETHLKDDMSHKEVLLIFGKPDNDLGSGIHIYNYSLDDGTEVRIGITDKILYANHLDSDQNLLKVLI